MTRWLTRVRGAIGMGITWAFALSLAGFLPRWVFGIEADLPFPVLFFGLGFVGGVIFSAILALAEGRRRFEEMSARRFAAWGAVGGLLLSALFVMGAHMGMLDLLLTAATFSLASAGCASGSLALARRAERAALPAGATSSSPGSD